MISTLRKATPNDADIMAAKFVGRDHPYYSRLIGYPSKHGLNNDERSYAALLEVVMCRERQLESAVALLTDSERERIGV